MISNQIWHFLWIFLIHLCSLKWCFPDKRWPGIGKSKREFNIKMSAANLGILIKNTKYHFLFHNGNPHAYKDGLLLKRVPLLHPRCRMISLNTAIGIKSSKTKHIAKIIVIENGDWHGQCILLVVFSMKRTGGPLSSVGRGVPGVRWPVNFAHKGSIVRHIFCWCCL